jgi:hypothetical protein
MDTRNLRATLAVACSFLVGIQPGLAFDQQQPSDTADLQYKLIIVRGDNAQNNIKKGRATRPVVEVRDRNNNPVAGVAVTFLLPSSGPSGIFVGGSQTTTVVTNAQGQAAASYTPNTVPGKFNINISASVSGQSVAAQIAAVNVLAGAAIAGSTMAIIIGVIAAAGAGAAVAATRSNGNGGTTTPTGIRITPGVGTAGPPR